MSREGPQQSNQGIRLDSGHDTGRTFLCVPDCCPSPRDGCPWGLLVPGSFLVASVPGPLISSVSSFAERPRCSAHLLPQPAPMEHVNNIITPLIKSHQV